MKVFSEPPKKGELKEREINIFPSIGKPSLVFSKNILNWMVKGRLFGWAFVYYKNIMKEGVKYAITGLADRERREPEPNAVPFTKE